MQTVRAQNEVVAESEDWRAYGSDRSFTVVTGSDAAIAVLCFARESGWMPAKGGRELKVGLLVRVGFEQEDLTLPGFGKV
jgi:hypothetical protein